MSGLSPSAEASRQELRSLLHNLPESGAPAAIEPLVDAARAQVERLRSLPDAAIRDSSLARVEQLCGLVADKEWIAPPSVTPRVLLALGWFVERAGDTGSEAEAGNLPDLLADDLHDEIEGHANYCLQRDVLLARRFADPKQRERLLVERRRQIRARIQARRWRRRARSSADGQPPAS